MASIGDLFVKVIADVTGLDADVVKGAKAAGEKGGKAMSTGLAAGLKTSAVKGFGLAASAAFGIATKGALELEEVQARIQSETGASADEAKKISVGINRIAGEERASLETVTEAAIKVRKDMGATGDEADKLTQSFVRYGRVTRQDAGAAVSDFDDILDAWGLTAEDAIGIQDKLLVSNQKYGGSITENQQALAKMAPQLRALNATVDDGIGLLNLFATSGLDASKAQGALNFAVKSLKPGQTLNDLVAEISAIEDPTLRAKRAIEVFGAKGGVALANALKPGMKGLSDFEVSAEDAAGSVDKAADALDNTFSGRIQKTVSQLGAAIRGLGSDFGPAATGAAGLASLFSTLGGGTLFKKLGGVGLGIGKKLGLRIAAGLASSSLVQGAQKIGAQIGLKIAAGLAGSSVVGAMSASLAGVFTAVGNSSLVTGASEKIGTTLGGKFGIAFKLAAVLGIAAIASEIAGPLQDIGKDIHEAILGKGGNPLSDFGKAWQDWRKDTPWPLGQKDAPDWASLGGEVEDGLDTAIVQPLDRAADNASLAAKKVVPAIKDGLTSAKPLLVGAMKDLIPPFGSDLAAKGKTAGEVLGRSVAEGVKSARAVVSDAMSILRDALDHEMSPAKERAQLLGELAGKELAHGLKSQDPIVRQAAEDAKNTILKRLEQLVPANGKLGKKSGAELAKALKSKDPEVRAAAQKLKASIEQKLQQTKAKAAGRRKGQDFADGVRSKKGAVGRAALALANEIANRLVGGLKGRLSDSQPGSGGSRRAAGGPVTAGTPYLVNENTPRSETFVPAVSGYVLTRADAMAAVERSSGHAESGTVVNVNTYGLPMYARTPVEVGRQVRRAIKAGTPMPPPRRASWSPS